MARAGARIWVNDLFADRAEAVCAEIAAEGGQAEPAIADVCDPAEVGRDGVTVNCIALGTMNHGQLAAAIEHQPELEAKLARNYPVGRVGRVDDSAPLAVLLCSDAAEWITGQVYPVDGGYASAL